MVVAWVRSHALCDGRNGDEADGVVCVGSSIEWLHVVIAHLFHMWKHLAFRGEFCCGVVPLNALTVDTCRFTLAMGLATPVAGI